MTITDKYSGSKSGIAKVTAQGKPDSTYLIEIELPPETIQSVKKNQTVSGCVSLPPGDPPVQEDFAFDEWTFVI